MSKPDFEKLPRIVRSGGGPRWIAIGAEGENPRIAVFGYSQLEAAANYAKRMRVWRELLVGGEEA